MSVDQAVLAAPVARPSTGRRSGPSGLATAWKAVRAQPLLWAGLAALALPTLFRVARESWSSEQGAHGPIVVATGIWLIIRQWPAIRAVARPGSPTLTWALLIPLLAIFVVARITSILEIEGVVMYACVVVVAYGLLGGRALRTMWFPLVYLLFIFPPPDSIFAAITQPLKIAISEWVVDSLHMLGYPIAGSGVSIRIGSYELLVAAACAGIYSLISLSAIGLFYSYIRHNSNWRYMVLLIAAIIPIAMLANFVRAVALVLVTYHFGEAAGQGFFHEFAGLTMFAVALLSIFLLDFLGTPLRDRLAPAGDPR